MRRSTRANGAAAKRRADILRLLDRPGEARAAYRQAIDFLRPLEGDADEKYRRALEECRRSLKNMSRD